MPKLLRYLDGTSSGAHEVQTYSELLAQSFSFVMSGMNYFDGDHVYPHVYALARAKPGRVITIDWIPGSTVGLFAFPSRVRKSIRAYRKWLPILMKGHRIKPEMLKELRTEVYLAKNFRLYVRAVAVDDRGKEYSQFVWA
jgi:hypothetical protein